MTTDKKKDSDVPYVAIVCGLFTIVLLIIDFTYKNFMGLFQHDSLWYGIPVIILHVALVISWVVVIKNFNNPNYNYWRAIAILVAIATSMLILFHRSEWLGKIDFDNTVKKNKEMNK